MNLFQLPVYPMVARGAGNKALTFAIISFVLKNPMSNLEALFLFLFPFNIRCLQSASGGLDVRPARNALKPV
jgi:hypothetical protein